MIDFSIMGRRTNMKVVELTRLIVAYRSSSSIGGSFRYPGDRARVAYSTDNGSIMRIRFDDEYEALVSPDDVKEIQL